MWKFLLGGGALVGGGVVGAAWYLDIPLRELLGGGQRAPPQSKDLPIPRPPAGDNRHPLDDAPWWRKTAIILKRAVVLTAIFTPLAMFAVVQQLGAPGGALRQLYLDTLVWCLELAGCSFMKFGQWLSMRPGRGIACATRVDSRRGCGWACGCGCGCGCRCGCEA